jgi:hypothetical protein
MDRHFKHSDGAWPKWVGWGVVLGGAWAIDQCIDYFTSDNANEAKPSKKDCSKAIKSLSQVDRLAQKFGKKIPQKRLDEWRRKIADGTITSLDLPATLQGEFPASLAGLALNEI